jgi:hypothetical protein
MSEEILAAGNGQQSWLQTDDAESPGQDYLARLGTEE